MPISVNINVFLKNRDFFSWLSIKKDIIIILKLSNLLQSFSEFQYQFIQCKNIASVKKTQLYYVNLILGMIELESIFDQTKLDTRYKTCLSSISGF